jgi:glucosamine--fructose-6-phosphate aminotransferase (isomerizing)
MGNRIKNESEVNLSGLENHKTQILEIDNLVIIASGTSYNAGLIGSIYMRMLQSIDYITIVDASEFCEYDIPMKGITGILVLSQSGETRDVYRAMELVKQRNLLVISIVNVVNSLIAREADCGIYINSGRENGVASTKSFTSQVIATALFALYISQNKSNIDKNVLVIRKQLIRSILDLPLDIENCLKTFEECKQLIPELKTKNSCFILGRKLCEPIAREGALKMKEISYIHAEGYPSGSLKHGPFAMIEDGTPIIILSPDMEQDDRCYSLAEEVKTRGALTILITNQTEIRMELFDYVIPIPYNKYFGNLLANIPLQTIAYELSIAKNINPDKPRNLAKVVTVDG